LKDTAQTLEAMGADAIVLRHGSSGSAHRLAHSGWVQSAVINAGDGSHEHPTQALLDAMTIRQALVSEPTGNDLSGKKVLIVGDISHSRVARSNLILLRSLGATVATCGPATLVPRSLEPIGGIYYSLDRAIEEFGPDAVIMLRIQSERMEASFFPTEREYSRVWGMNSVRLSRLGKASIVLHPGPMNRGLEIDAASADSSKSRILDQVQNGVAVRMAVLFHLLAGEKGESR
jgi:aspartate carbamoyltransferase catalytic subunit